MVLDFHLCRQAMLARDARFDGRFFTAVKTTRIYCRPICPARPPRAENCVFMPTAAAAQAAGFRPCLRCRPETSPGMGAWLGTSNTVSRALALIDAGALDTAGTDALANRLGIGGRQLRRLFLHHLGAAPIAVAQTRRVLLAKQLLHETNLSMAEIAYASGFGSVRRFNQVFQALFDRPPAGLRRQRRTTTQAAPAITLSLGYRPPYDWDAMLVFLAVRAIPGVEVVEQGAYSRTIELDGVAGTVSVVDDPARSRLLATIRYPDLRTLPLLIARLRRLFDVEADPGIICAALSADVRLRPFVQARPGLRVPGAWCGFELGVCLILERPMSETAAARAAGQIAQSWGTMFADARATTGLTRVFPRPEMLAGAVITGVPSDLADAVIGFAKAAATHPHLFERGSDLATSVNRLRDVLGVDEWSAQHIAMRSMREPDAFPENDHRLTWSEDGACASPTIRTLSSQAESWRPWRAYAAVHLWTALSSANVGSKNALAA